MSDENQLSLEMLGVTGLNSFAAHNSSSRAVMFGNHISQRLLIEEPDEKRVQSGLEHEFSKYTFNIKMPEDGKIINIIERYPKGVGENTLNFNPETVIIFEVEATKEIDCFILPYYLSHHQFFGFKYEHTDNISKIKVGAFIAKDTVFSDSNAVSKNGGYKYGANLNTAFMTLPSTSEDGFMISDAVLDKLSSRLFETRTIEFGSKAFPLNLYGNQDEYKVFPDIGEYIEDTRSDGLLMMLRDYDESLVPALMSKFDCTEPDFTFDRGTYVRGGNGRVVDIKVIGNNNRIKNLPVEVTQQIVKYQKAYINFYKEIIATEERIRYERKRKFGDNALKLSPKLHALLVEALAVVNPKQSTVRQPLNLLYRQASVDEFRVEIIVEYLVKPDIGFKYTDSHGKILSRVQSKSIH